MSGLAISAPPSLSANVQFAIKKLRKLRQLGHQKAFIILALICLFSVFALCGLSRTPGTYVIKLYTKDMLTCRPNRLLNAFTASFKDPPGLRQFYMYIVDTVNE